MVRSHESDDRQSSSPLGAGMLTAWVDALKAIPGAAKAISHLISGAADAGNAWTDVIKAMGEQRAQQIRDETNANYVFMKSITKVATDRAMQSTELVDRAVSHLSATLTRGQATREEIAFLAVSYLRDDPPPTDMKEEPDGDWLNLFSSLASRASSKTMKEHWARILKGEIRTPGTFSLSTLKVMSVLDNTLADTVVRVWPAVIDDGYIATIGRFNESPFYADLFSLDTLGLLRLGHSFPLVSSGEGECAIWCGRRALIFKGMPPHQKAAINVGVLSQSGKEFASIVPFGGNEDIVRELGPLIMKEFRARTVFLSDYDPRTRIQYGPVELLDEQEVPS
jgi:hypothetical protein